ncbi:MAG: DUF4350 domain-containing protein [Erythrobacter sp.]|uniref:DUF4350 domain-containing protein n=1 Tax=Erythrobacter sp. TaxID=1042 RepID=UPI003267AAD4
MTGELAPVATTGAARGREAASPFGKSAVLAMLVVGFAAFVAMLYFIGTGDTGGNRGTGPAHASSNAIHGYAGLSQLLEANGYDVEKSREQSGLETSGLLVLTPTQNTDPDEFAAILEERQYQGPTLVILPKWFAIRPSGKIAEEDEDQVQDDWVQLVSSNLPGWTQDLPEPYTLETAMDPDASGATPSWGGLGLSGNLPAPTPLYAENSPNHEALVIDDKGRPLAVNVVGQPDTYFYEDAHFLTVVIEPDLLNNYGLADPTRAALALAIVEQAGYEDKQVTFDLTLVGLGGSTNLLTLAFRPPFLAATICLILAMLIVGWRAFLRFGPVAAQSQEARFGKAQLVTNGAGLIVRARRLRLLADPYVALIERKLGNALGLAKPDATTIDQALEQRLPDEEPFSNRVARLQNATKPSEVMRAAQSLSELASKTTGKSRR